MSSPNSNFLNCFKCKYMLFMVLILENDMSNLCLYVNVIGLHWFSYLVVYWLKYQLHNFLISISLQPLILKKL